ncbi:class I SAM-dependent methyltransferase [Salinisphaera sp. T31B1]|uniref:O-methyltransferase n=1 Tax=Salinisphaera sp. T31B1 TaxID=727963 RepID=UPI003341CFD0
MKTTNIDSDVARFEALRAETDEHRQRHGCHAYVFEDGAGLLAAARAERPERILELGTAIGYTACLLASAEDRAQMDTIERDPDHVALARENLEAAGFAEHVRVHHGDFFDVLADLPGPYDLAFFDGLAPSLSLIEQLYERLKPNGLLICGNLCLAHGANQRLLDAEFATAERWHIDGHIENGATSLIRKTGGST